MEFDATVVQVRGFAGFKTRLWQSQEFCCLIRDFLFKLAAEFSSQHCVINLISITTHVYQEAQNGI